MSEPLTHSELCKLAVGWLKRPNSRGGHGCKVAIDECRTGWSGETPDAIGYTCTGLENNIMDGTVLVECKVSRADFLADRAKPHRKDVLGVGNWRYYMAPEGLIKPEELPEKWGLIEVNSRRHLKLVVGPFTDTNYHNRIDRLIAARFDSDTTREFFLVVRMLSRIEDPDKIIDIGKERNRLAFKVNDIANELRKEKSEHSATKFKNQLLEEELANYKKHFGDIPVND